LKRAGATPGSKTGTRPAASAPNSFASPIELTPTPKSRAGWHLRARPCWPWPTGQRS
jgi:hypothetical protein